MKMKLPKYTHAFIDRHGKPRFYLRRPGMYVPLPGVPWSPEFMAAREAALGGEWGIRPDISVNRIVPGTVNSALISYYQSSTFTQRLAPSSQTMRRAILERFREEHGDKRIAKMDTRALQVIIGKKTPSAAQNWHKTLAGFIEHAMSLGMIASNPLQGVKLVPVKSKGHHSWTTDECAQFEAHHALGTRARLAYELLLQVGHSRSDVVRMGRQHVRNGVLSLHRQKTKVTFDVPVMPMLQAAIDAMPPSDSMMFLVTHKGNPFTAAGFGNWFRRICNEADLPSRCTSHGLRKAAATRAAERGATAHQLMAWFGWKTIGEAERYTRSADRKQASATLGRLIMATEVANR